MIAARFPSKVNSLVLAGSPIDTDAGDGPIKRMVHASPMSFYEELVDLGGDLMKGKFIIGFSAGQGRIHCPRKETRSTRHQLSNLSPCRR